jgi:hypothetical protein
MAKARRVVADQGSAELDELRRQFNNLLVVIENTSDLTSLKAAIVAGGEDGVELNGVKPTPVHPRRPRDGTLVALDASSDF